MEIKITRVENNAQLMKFIKSQWNFYKNDKNWVPPMLADRKKTLDIGKNPFYKHSKIQLFIAESDGNIVGRIAAIVNENHNKTHNDKTGFWGFFECIDNQEVADLLFKTAGDWLKSNGMDSMIGPENPSMNDEIGMLFEGYDSPPVVLMTYNPPYYNILCENAGMTKAKDVFAYVLTPETFISDKARQAQNIIIQRNKLTLRNINLKDKNQFKKDVQTLKDIYNSAWQPNWGFVKWTDEEFDFIAGDLKQIADPRLALIAECDGKIAGFVLALPNINEVLIYNKNGGMIGAIWQLLTKKKLIKFVRIIALGILPEFQKTGIDSVLYYEVGKRGLELGFNRGEGSWILEDNEPMNRALTKTMNGEVYKKYRLYFKGL